MIRYTNNMFIFVWMDLSKEIFRKVSDGNGKNELEFVIEQEYKGWRDSYYKLICLQ
jgi:hypothetical protein